MPEFSSSFDDVLGIGRKISKEELIRAIRFFVAAEYEAIQLYVKIAEATDYQLAKEVLLDIAEEEKVHAGEFLRLLFELDPKESDKYKEGYEEVEDIMKKSKSGLTDAKVRIKN
jgi:rubrerythrin